MKRGQYIDLNTYARALRRIGKRDTDPFDVCLRGAAGGSRFIEVRATDREDALKVAAAQALPGEVATAAYPANYGDVG